MTLTAASPARPRKILGGAPVFVGTRVPVKTLYDYLEAGDSLDEFLNDFSSVIACRSARPRVARRLPRLHLNMTSRQQRRLWRHVESIENFWESLVEIEPGAVQRLATVAHERRWEVIFLTKRPETVGAIAQVQSQRWLASRGFTLPSVYAPGLARTHRRLARPRHRVDDRPENCLDASSTRRHARFCTSIHPASTPTLLS